MSSLYQITGQMLADWAGEDAGVRTDSSTMGRQIVDTIVKEISEHGFPSVDKAACHDEPCGRHRGVRLQPGLADAGPPVASSLSSVVL